jgi:hypothetical protein
MIGQKVVNVGYVLVAEKSQAAFPEPRLVGPHRFEAISHRAVQACPAVNQYEARLVEICSPFSLRLRCIPSATGKFSIHLVPDGTRLDDELIPTFVSVMPREFWRNNSFPVIQIAIPYCFICDEVCYLTQLPPYLSRSFASFPGLFISGRFPTHVWPRTLNLAFEWTDFDKDLIIKRNTPISYVMLETSRPELPIRLRRAKLTPDVRAYRSQMEDVPKFTSGTFALIKDLARKRPKELLAIED